jgi:hypothetical protein
MAKPVSSKRKTAPKRVLRLPDLDLAKRTVLNSLGSPDSTRAYAHAIDDFIAWYCSEPRLAFGKANQGIDSKCGPITGGKGISRQESDF